MVCFRYTIVNTQHPVDNKDEDDDDGDDDNGNSHTFILEYIYFT